MTTSDPRDALARIKARADEATPGPWGFLEDTRVDGGLTYRVGSDETGGDVCDMPRHPMPRLADSGDAEFIAHSRSDVPRLVAALAEVLYELDSIESDLGRDIEDILEDLSTVVPPPAEHAIDRGFSMIRAERAVVGRVRRAIEDMLNEEEA